MRNYFVFLILGIAIGAAVTLVATKRNAGTVTSSADPIRADRSESKTEVSQPVCPVCETAKNAELLPPPSFANDSPQVFETNQEAEVMINWQAVENASRYRIVLTDASGTRIKTYSTKGLRLYLRGIPRERTATRTEYGLHMVTINSADLEGPAGEIRKLVVHSKAKIQAPAIKTIRIED
jgi:hypothetical protein